MKLRIQAILFFCGSLLILSSCSVSKQIEKMTFPVTIDSKQVKTAKLVTVTNALGMVYASVDVTFPHHDKINPEKGAVLTFIAPGYNKYSLVIPPKTTQSHFDIVFTENPKEMAKLRQYEKQYQNDPTIRTGEATNMVTRDAPGQTALERTILRWHFDSDPRGGRIFWRVISSIPDQVKNTNETYLTSTPYEETRSFNILGLTYENSRDVTIEIKVTKKGYMDQVKRYNVRQAIDQQEISGFFELVEDN